MEDGSGQSSERLTRRSDPGLTFQGSIRVKQVKRERMGIPEGYEDRRLMAGHPHEPRSPELPREPRPLRMDSANCEAVCHITRLLKN